MGSFSPAHRTAPLLALASALAHSTAHRWHWGNGLFLLAHCTAPLLALVSYFGAQHALLALGAAIAF
jgi:hypothetical protein